MERTSIEGYLQSEKAERDVAGALGDTFHRGPWSVISPGEFGWVTGCSYLHDEVHSDPLRVYFRSEGDRYIVTDLGEAVRALRLRTGRMDAVERAGRAWVEMAGPGTWNAGTMSENCAAADLPRAIVRVMLAAVRVAALEV